MSDATSVLIWWLTIFIIGTLFLPITFFLFHRFIDRGYIFAKVIGILLSSYLLWLLGGLKVVPFERFTIISILLLAAVINLYLLKRIDFKNLLAKLPLPLIVFEECLFFVALAFWSYVRATEPSIRGLEKFMDFGFVNSILRGQFFPPLDMWLTKSPDYNGGYFINYYYFGHYVTAFLTKLSGIDSVITYNLMLATLFAFTLTLSFSIGMNLYYLFSLITSNKDIEQKELKTPRGWQAKRSEAMTPPMVKGAEGQKLRAVIAGLLAAFIVTFGGNLHTIYTLTSNYPLENPAPLWQLELGFYPERYWYPNATRFIPFTIHEFPIYSFVVADLHGHVSDIPFVLLTLAILLTIIIRVNRHAELTLRHPELVSEPVLNSIQESHGIPDQVRNDMVRDDNKGIKKFLQEFEDHTSISLLHVALLGLLLGVMYMTNAWDGLIYMILTGLVFLYINLKRHFTHPHFSLSSVIYKTFSASLFLLFFFLIVSLPFSLNFRPFVSGVGVLCAPSFLLGKKIGPFLFETSKCQKSPIWMLMILWGFFYYNVIGFLVFAIIPSLRKKIVTRLQHFGSILLSLSPVDIFILLLIFISTLLLIFPEFFYIKDIYPAHYRANTMFKLGYQSFMMLGLASGYIILRLKHVLPEVKRKLFFIVYNSLFILLFTLIGIYPYFAINSYYGGLKVYRGLDGLNWLAAQYPDDYKVIEWLRKNIQCNNVVMYQCNNQPVLVEAQGDSYTDYARVSANTGLPTIVGWPVHEWLWRGSYDEAGRRIPEVSAIYESKDLKLTKDILKKYNVEYIFVGNLEREKYKQLDEKKLESLGKVVFESGKTRVYKVNN